MLNTRILTPTLEIYLLDTFRVKIGGVIVEEHRWQRPSAKKLVKLLALKPHHQLHREQIIDLLWTEQEPETALKKLNKVIYLARRALEPNLAKGSDSQFILTQKQQTILHSPGELFIDLEEFERLAAAAIKNNDLAAGKKALELYRGDLLVEDVYEDWLMVRRETLRILYRKAAAKTAQLYMQTGEYRQSIEILKKLVIEDPTDEYVHRQLMLAHAQTGSKYQALKQFEQCRAALLSLGAGVETETIELAENIRAGKILRSEIKLETNGNHKQPPPSLPVQAEPWIRQISFQRGGIQSARFSPDDKKVVYSGALEGNSLELYTIHRETGEAVSLGVRQAGIFGVSPAGEIAAALNRKFLRGYVSAASLARLNFSGGTARAMFENVQWADWHPGKNCRDSFSDNECFAVVRDDKGKNALEYPVGNVLYQTGGWISHPRFSPDGKRIAFIEHPTPADDSGSVAVVELEGENKRKKEILSGGWISVQGLAWAGDEIWFTAAREGNARTIHAVNLNGAERLIFRGIGSLTLHDIAKSGEALVTVEKTRIQIQCRASDQDVERDLSWHDWSLARDLSADGKMLLFTEAGESGGSLYATYVRSTSGSAPVRLGDGSALALSPDAKYALVRIHVPVQQLALVPVGAGEKKLLAPARSNSFFYQPWACFFPDGKRVLFAANEQDRGTRLYVQEIDGNPVCITPDEEGVEISSPHSISPGGEQFVFINAENEVCRFEINSKKCTPLKNLGEDYLPVRWSGDGRYLFVRRRGQVPAIVYRYDLSAGEKEERLELMPKDATGVSEILRVLLTPDGAFYAYSYTRELSDLYVIENLR